MNQHTVEMASEAMRDKVNTANILRAYGSHEENSIRLQRMFEESPFDDIKIFVPPDVDATVEEVTAEMLKVMPQLTELHNGDKEPEDSF